MWLRAQNLIPFTSRRRWLPRGFIIQGGLCIQRRYCLFVFPVKLFDISDQYQVSRFCPCDAVLLIRKRPLLTDSKQHNIISSCISVTPWTWKNKWRRMHTSLLLWENKAHSSAYFSFYQALMPSSIKDHVGCYFWKAIAAVWNQQTGRRTAVSYPLWFQWAVQVLRGSCPLKAATI